MSQVSDTIKRYKGEVRLRASYWRETLAYHQEQRERHDKRAKECLLEIQGALVTAYTLKMKTPEIWEK